MNEELSKFKLPRFRVNVTREIIDTAVQADSNACMIADAVKESWSKKFGRSPIAVSVDIQTIRLTDPEEGRRHIWPTPPKAAVGLTYFDNGDRALLIPFCFQLMNGHAIAVKRQGGHRATKPETQKKLNQRHAALRKLKRARLRVTAQGRRTSPLVSVLGGKEPPQNDAAIMLASKQRKFGLQARTFKLQRQPAQAEK